MTEYLPNKEMLEIEAKFVCPDGLVLDNLLDVVNAAGCQCTEKTPCLQMDVYFDTPAYTLLNSNAALRIRQRGESYVGAYKSSEKQKGAIFERKESQWVLSDNEIKTWNEEKKPTIPTNITSKLNLSGQILRKVLVVETQRRTVIVSNKEFKAELSFDNVTFRGHKGQIPYREIEIELLEGRFKQFEQLTANIQERLKLQPAEDSKYKKGMILVGKYGAKVSTQYGSQ